MNSLEQVKKQLSEFKEKRTALLHEIKKWYDEDNSYEDESAVESAIGDDFILDWEEQREYVYASDTIQCQEQLISVLEKLEHGDAKSRHNAKTALDDLVREARKIKKLRTEEIQQAQAVVDAMNAVLKVCDESRK